MPTWPAGLPQYPEPQSYSEGPGVEATLRTPMDVGPPKRRRQYTAEVSQHQITLMLNASERTTFDAFWQTTLEMGALSFDWINWFTGSAASYALVGRPQYSAISGTLWRVSMTLERLP